MKSTPNSPWSPSGLLLSVCNEIDKFSSSFAVDSLQLKILVNSAQTNFSFSDKNIYCSNLQFSNKNRPGIRVSFLYFVRSYPECCWRPITSVNPTTYLSEPIFQSNSFSKSCYSSCNTKWLNIFLDEFHSIRKLSDKMIWISCSSRFAAIRLLDIVMIFYTGY